MGPEIPADAVIAFAPSDLQHAPFPAKSYADPQTWRAYFGDLFWRYGFPWPRITASADRALPIHEWRERWNRLPDEVRYDLGVQFESITGIWRDLFIQRMGLELEPHPSHRLRHRSSVNRPMTLTEISEAIASAFASHATACTVDHIRGRGTHREP